MTKIHKLHKIKLRRSVKLNAPMSKAVMKIARKRGLPIINVRLSKSKPADMQGLPNFN